MPLSSWNVKLFLCQPLAKIFSYKTMLVYDSKQLLGTTGKCLIQFENNLWVQFGNGEKLPLFPYHNFDEREK